MKKLTRKSVMLVSLILAIGAMVFSIAMEASYIPSTVTVQVQPDVIVEVLDSSLVQYIEPWRVEVGRRFHNAVAIIVHGGDFVEGEWVVGAGIGGHISRASDIARHYQKLYAGRTLVFISCNPGHLKINVPGVWYASDVVWCIPDRGMSPKNMSSSRRLLDWATWLEDGEKPEQSRWEAYPTVVGNIFEFIQD
jgi:hypothetical protein